jgi:uncharacterized membrane protein
MAVGIDLIATALPLAYLALGSTLLAFATAGYAAVDFAEHDQQSRWASYGSAMFVLLYGLAGYLLARRLGHGGELYLGTLNLCMSLMASRAGIRMGALSALRRSRR